MHHGLDLAGSSSAGFAAEKVALRAAEQLARLGNSNESNVRCREEGGCSTQGGRSKYKGNDAGVKYRLRHKSSVWVLKESLAVSEVGAARMPPNDFESQDVEVAWQD